MLYRAVGIDRPQAVALAFGEDQIVDLRFDRHPARRPAQLGFRLPYGEGGIADRFALHPFAVHPPVSVGSPDRSRLRRHRLPNAGGKCSTTSRRSSVACSIRAPRTRWPASRAARDSLGGRPSPRSRSASPPALAPCGTARSDSPSRAPSADCRAKSSQLASAVRRPVWVFGTAAGSLQSRSGTSGSTGPSWACGSPIRRT